MEKLYVVTLWKHEDLNDLYTEMELKNIRCDKKREMSRNTHYWMTEEQVNQLRPDPRVRAIELHDSELGVVYKPSYTPYTLSNQNFFRDNVSYPAEADAANHRDWGKLYCAGNETQRRDTAWGHNTTHIANDTVTVFSDGRDVDLIIVDDNASYDCGEWNSPSTGSSRYVQYDWYGQLRQYVPSLPISSYNSRYRSNASNNNYHGTHVMSTAGGQHYGWAREANLYNFDYINTQVGINGGDNIDTGDVMDMLRAFHKNKPLNSQGKRNPTVTNHSYGAALNRDNYAANCTSIRHKGVTYTPASPGPSGWTAAGLLKDFGVQTCGLASKNPNDVPYRSTSYVSDIEDAIDDGIVLIGAAGNDNYKFVRPDDDEFGDSSTHSYNQHEDNDHQGGSSSFTVSTRTGMGPPAGGMIMVGSLDTDRYNLRSNFSNHGPGIDVWAPGSFILGAFNSYGTADSKYGGNNYYRAISGTSMASPQVAGVAACLASGRERFHQDDMLDYIERYSHNIGSDGTPELRFDGEHNSSNPIPGRYYRSFSGTPESSIRVNMRLLPDLHLGTSSTVMRSGYPLCIIPTSNSGTGWSIFFDSSSDRWFGANGPEQHNGEDDRDIRIFEGDRITFVYPRKICQVNVADSTTSGWIFKRGIGEPYNTFGSVSPDTYNRVPIGVDTGDRSARDFVTGVSGNPTLHLLQGDMLVVRGVTTSHPFWIKSSLGSGSTGAITDFHVYNNGGQSTLQTSFLGGTDNLLLYFRLYGASSSVGGEVVWHTEFTTPGTYYYQCGNHSSMYGEIVVHDSSTAFNNHKIYIKTAQTVDSTSDLVTGTNPGDVTNQGVIELNPANATNGVSWQTRSGDAGTYYYQCGSYAGGGQIIVEAHPGAGSYHDTSAKKDSPTNFLNCISPRVTSGNINTQVGRRNKSSITLKYPRRSTLRRA